MTTQITKSAFQPESFEIPLRMAAWALCKLLIRPAQGFPDLICDVAEMLGSAKDKCKAALCVSKSSGLGAINNNKYKLEEKKRLKLESYLCQTSCIISLHVNFSVKWG